MNFYIFAVLSALEAVSKASNPYYYVPPHLQYQLPTAFSSFGNPFPTSTFYVNPHYQYRSFVNPIHQIQHDNYQTQLPTSPPPPPTDYQGFAYHTRNDNGATSHVLFVSGPQSQTLRSTLFPTFNTPSFKNNADTEKAKSYASDMIDTVDKQTKETGNQFPKNIYPRPVAPSVEQIQEDPAQFFRNFFQSEPNVVNFYSRNSNLFVRPVSGFAANTFPLRGGQSGRSNAVKESNERYYSPFINPRFEMNPEVTTTTELNDKKSENVAQESVITNTRFRINELIDRVEKLTATTTMLPIVVQDVKSSMQPIVVQETTIETINETTEQNREVTTTSDVEESSTTIPEVPDLMKTLLSLLAQDSSSSEQPKDVSTEESTNVLTEESTNVSTEESTNVSSENSTNVSSEEPKNVSTTTEVKDVTTDAQEEINSSTTDSIMQTTQLN